MTNTKIKEKQQFFGKVKYLTPRFESKKEKFDCKILKKAYSLGTYQDLKHRI